jgi:prepilin-type processing-associated H-X9-DG protein
MESESPTHKERLQVTTGCLFAIMGLSAVFLFARQKGISRRCQSNLRLLNVSLTMYMRDYDETVFPTADWALLRPYLKSPSISHCPNARYGYALNRYLIGASSAGVADWNAIDSRTRRWKTAATFYDSAADSAYATDGGESWMQPGRHRGGSNVAFFDGHVRWMIRKPGFLPISSLKARPKKSKKATHK